MFNVSFSQNIQWQNTIGGSDVDLLWSVNQTLDSGYILGGMSNSNISGDKLENSLGIFDFWVIKLDGVGNTQWQNTIGGDGYEWLYSVNNTTDGGYILGGISKSNISGDKTENNLGGSDYWVVKLNAAGSIQWQNTIGGSSVDALNSIQQTVDGGYILGGTSASNISGDKTENSLGLVDYWVIKLDSLGNIQWQNTIGGSLNDHLMSIQQTISGDYILGGFSESNISGDKSENSLGDADYWVVKLDTSGNTQWQNTIGGDTIDELRSIQQTLDGGYILGGSSLSNISGDKTENSLGGYDYWIVKLDSVGNIQWQNTIGGNSYEQLFKVKQASDSGFFLGGYSFSNISGDKTENNLGGSDFWIIKMDSIGNIQWQNTIGGSLWDALISLDATNDNNYILGGISDSDISFDKTENCLGDYDYWVVKINDTTLTTSLPQLPQLPNYPITLSPNPADELIVIGYQFNKGDVIRLTDVLGKTVFTKTFSSPPSALRLPVTAFPNGIYFLSLQSEKKAFHQKLVIAHQ